MVFASVAPQDVRSDDEEEEEVEGAEKKQRTGPSVANMVDEQKDQANGTVNGANGRAVEEDEKAGGEGRKEQ